MSTLKIKRENGKIFCPLADSWHIETPEEKVRQEYIKILVENYGYSLDQMAQEIKVNNEDKLYSFIMRGELTKVSLEDSGVVSKHSSSAALTQKYIDSLSLDLLDDECVESAKVMATVYTAIAAFENMVRQFVVKILMENKGENWWTECVSDKIRKSADSRKAEEDKIKWHTHRGTSMINYVDFADLANIMGQNYDLFEVHIVSLEWAKQIFTTLEKSRNVIMHSGELGERDIERIGINIRDWISQVGA